MENALSAVLIRRDVAWPSRPHLGQGATVMTPAELLRDCSFEIAARGHARLANVQYQIPAGTAISIAFLVNGAAD